MKQQRWSIQNASPELLERYITGRHEIQRSIARWHSRSYALFRGPAYRGYFGYFGIRPHLFYFHLSMFKGKPYGFSLCVLYFSVFVRFRFTL